MRCYSKWVIAIQLDESHRSVKSISLEDLERRASSPQPQPRASICSTMMMNVMLAAGTNDVNVEWQCQHSADDVTMIRNQRHPNLRHMMTMLRHNASSVMMNYLTNAFDWWADWGRTTFSSLEVCKSAADWRVICAIRNRTADTNSPSGSTICSKSDEERADSTDTERTLLRYRPSWWTTIRSWCIGHWRENLVEFQFVSSGDLWRQDEIRSRRASGCSLDVALTHGAISPWCSSHLLYRNRRCLSGASVVLVYLNKHKCHREFFYWLT